MGVDACLFLKNNKKYFYFDRLFNIQNFDIEDEGYDQTYERYIHLVNEGINQGNFFLLLSVNRKNSIEDKVSLYWIDKLWKIATIFPLETFFVRSDIHDEYYDLCDEYEEIDESLIM